MKFNIVDLVIVISALFLASVTAETRANDSVAMVWKMKQIHQPSADQLRREQQGHVFIYAGLKDRQVDQIVNTRFERLDRMMFTRVIVTDERGEPAINRETGEVEVLDGGCD